MSSAAKARLALAAVCLFWGTTYLAIRVVVADLPPSLFCSVRFFLAGLPMLVWALWRGHPPPRGRDWPDIVVTSILLLTAGNGMLAWAEQWVPTGIASILVVTTPLWMAVFAALAGERVRARAVTGLLLGFLGLLVVLWPDLAPVSPSAGFVRGAIGILLSSMTWAFGSVYTKMRPPRTSPVMTAAIQMLIGSAIFAAAAFLNGEGARWDPALKHWLAILYLVVFGSMVGYGSYLYALAHLPTPQVSIYAYVNPLVAVGLGAVLLGERADRYLAAGMPLVLFGVYLAGSATPPPTPDALETATQRRPRGGWRRPWS